MVIGVAEGIPLGCALGSALVVGLELEMFDGEELS